MMCDTANKHELMNEWMVTLSKSSTSSSVQIKEWTLLFAFVFDFWADSAIILAIKPRIITQGRARYKFLELYDACSVANIPRAVLDKQIWFDYGYVWTYLEIFESGKKILRIKKYPDMCGRGLICGMLLERSCICLFTLFLDRLVALLA